MDEETYEPQEFYFATHLGVEKDERFFNQLLAVAKAALYDVPERWTVGVYEDPEIMVAGTKF